MQPWLVSGFHRPFYTAQIGGNTMTSDIGNELDERAAWELLFFQYQVDMCARVSLGLLSCLLTLLKT